MHISLEILLKMYFLRTRCHKDKEKRLQATNKCVYYSIIMFVSSTIVIVGSPLYGQCSYYNVLHNGMTCICKKKMVRAYVFIIMFE